jgi:hypothetical protein
MAKEPQTKLETILRCAPIISNPVGIGIGIGLIASTEYSMTTSAVVGFSAAILTVVFILVIDWLINL